MDVGEGYRDGGERFSGGGGMVRDMMGGSVVQGGELLDVGEGFTG